MHLQNLAGAAAFSLTLDGGDDSDHAIQALPLHTPGAVPRRSGAK